MGSFVLARSLALNLASRSSLIFSLSFSLSLSVVSAVLSLSLLFFFFFFGSCFLPQWKALLAPLKEPSWLRTRKAAKELKGGRGEKTFNSPMVVTDPAWVRGDWDGKSRSGGSQQLSVSH